MSTNLIINKISIRRRDLAEGTVYNLPSFDGVLDNEALNKLIKALNLASYVKHTLLQAKLADYVQKSAHLIDINNLNDRINRLNIPELKINEDTLNLEYDGYLFLNVNNCPEITEITDSIATLNTRINELPNELLKLDDVTEDGEHLLITGGDYVRYIPYLSQKFIKVTASTNDSSLGSAYATPFVLPGQSALLVAEATISGEFVKWQNANGVSISTNAIHIVNGIQSNVTYTAIFKEKEQETPPYTFTLTWNPDTVSEIIIHAGNNPLAIDAHTGHFEAPIPNGTPLSITSIKFKEGYLFGSLVVNDVTMSITDPELPMNEALTIVINSIQKTYFITVNTKNCSVTGIKNNGYTHGELCTLTATANTGYSFEGWYTQNDELITANTTYQFQVTESRVLIAKAVKVVPKYTVTVTQPTGGTITVKDTSGNAVDLSQSVESGTTLRFIVEEDSDHLFTKWVVNNVEQLEDANTLELTIDKNTAVSASFVNAVTITTLVSPTGAGTVTGGGKYPQSDTETSTLIATVKPNNHRHFTKWIKDSSTEYTTSTLSVSLTESATYRACFDLDTNTIRFNVEPTGSGTIQDDGTNIITKEVEYGGSFTVTAEAATNYNFVKWMQGNTLISNNPELTRENITAPATYTAYFELIELEPEFYYFASATPNKTDITNETIVQLSEQVESGVTWYVTLQVNSARTLAFLVPNTYQITSIRDIYGFSEFKDDFIPELALVEYNSKSYKLYWYTDAYSVLNGRFKIQVTSTSL